MDCFGTNRCASQVTCLSPSLRACEAIQMQEVMFIFELFRVIALPIDIRCIICYKVTTMKQISSECQVEMLYNSDCSEFVFSFAILCIFVVDF